MRRWSSTSSARWGALLSLLVGASGCSRHGLAAGGARDAANDAPAPPDAGSTADGRADTAPALSDGGTDTAPALSDGSTDTAPAPSDGSTDTAPAPSDGGTDKAPSDGSTDTAPAPSDSSTDTGSPPSVFKLSDGGGLQLQVASDRSGVPVVMWTDRSTGQINSVYWNAGATQWVPLEVLDGTGNFLIDPDGSGHPLVRWNAPPPTGTTSFDKTVRRFDPVSGAWGPLVTLPGPPSLANAWQLAIDGAGNTHAFWRETTSASYWSWWRAGSASWEAAVPFDEVYSLVVVPAATFMWYERNELGVRRFDAQAGAWSDLVQLADLTKESDIRVHLLAVGRDGAPLMVSYRRDPTALAIEAWHGQPGTNAWGTRELVESIPQTTDPNQLTGPIGAFADPAHDFFWVPATAADGTFETHVERFDPVQGTWALSRVLHSTIENPRVDLQTDSAGRAYGYVNDGTLMRMDPAAPTWQDTAGGVGSGILRTSDNGAFLVGYINGDEVGALRSDAGGEWRPARGYPGGAHADVGSVPFGMAIAGPERAILVWTTYYGPDTGVWAAFLE